MAIFEPFFVDVVTRKLDDPSQETVKVINYSSAASRKWLEKHCFWAFNNGYAVMTAKSENQKQSA
jgi:hypothetical protein